MDLHGMGRHGGRAADGAINKRLLLEQAKEAELKAEAALEKGDQVEAKKWLEQAAAMRRFAGGRWMAGDEAGAGRWGGRKAACDAGTETWLDENQELKADKGADAPKNAANIQAPRGRHGGRARPSDIGQITELLTN
jgi:hypothetical protein